MQAPDITRGFKTLYDALSNKVQTPHCGTKTFCALAPDFFSLITSLIISHHCPTQHLLSSKCRHCRSVAMGGYVAPCLPLPVVSSHRAFVIQYPCIYSRLYAQLLGSEDPKSGKTCFSAKNLVFGRNSNI